jgi:hypothetical protein
VLVPGGWQARVDRNGHLHISTRGADLDAVSTLHATTAEEIDALAH